MTSPQFEEKRNALDRNMQEAESILTTEQAREDYVTITFLSLHGEYERKQIDHETYIKLINQLATFHQGAYNDYVDMLTGAAMIGMLDIMISQMTRGHDLAEEARKRSQSVTDLTGLPPVPPDDK